MDQAAADRATLSQAGALRRDVAVVKRQLEFEQERRREVERLLQEERSERVPHEHREAMAKRAEEIEAIRIEKEAMLEWLRRGVTEAQRTSVASEEVKLRKEAAAMDARELEAERDRLKSLEARLAEEIAAAKDSLDRLHKTRTSMAQHEGRQHDLAALCRDIVAAAANDKGRLEADVAVLQRRARDMETVETAIDCLSAAARRAEHELDRICVAVVAGKFAHDGDENWDGSLAGPDYDYESDDDAEPTRAPVVLATVTRGKVARADALLVSLRRALERFESDEQLRMTRSRDEMAAEAEQLRQRNAEAVATFAKDEAHLRARIADREPMLREASMRRQSAIDEEIASRAQQPEPTRRSPVEFDLDAAEQPFAAAPAGDAEPKPFSLMDHTRRENDRLLMDIEAVESDNERLRAKAAARKEDYLLFREMRASYRDLEAAKTMMLQELRETERANEDLKQKHLEFTDEETFASDAAGSRKGTIAGKKPPWRVTAAYT